MTKERTEEIEIMTARMTRFGRADWGAILAAVVSGLGITYLLVALGRAIGLTADEGVLIEETTVIAIGSWTVISSVIGMAIGAFIGGRFARWLTSGSAIYSGITAWAAMLLLTAWFGTNGADALLGTGLLNIVAGAGDAGDIIDWNGWALIIGMALTLLASVFGWFAGSRMGLGSFEESDVVTDRSKVEVPAGGRIRT